MERNVYKSNLFIMFVVILEILSSLIAVPIARSRGIGMYTLMAIVNIMFLAVPLVAYFLVTKKPVKETLKLNKIGIKDVFIIILLSIFFQPIMNFLSGLIALILPNNVGAVLSQSANVPLWIRIVVLALMPAMLEEMCMRGVVLSGYKKLSIKKAAIITGLIFAILHMNLQMFLYTFVMGILFAYLVYITDSIFSSMLCHFIINATQVTAAGIAAKKAGEVAETGKKVGAAALMLPMDQKILFIVGGLIVATISLVIVIALMKKLAKMHNVDLKSIQVPTIGFEDDLSDVIIESTYGEISASVEKEKILNWPFIVIVVIYVMNVGSTLYMMFK